MRRLTNWIAGILSGVIAYRLWKRWQKLEPATAPVAAERESDDRAEELRTKLAEARASEESAPTEPTEQTAEQPAESIEERRRRVHEEGRAAIDRMNDS